MLVSLLINLVLVCQAELCGLGTEASSGGFAAAWQEETLLAAFVAAKDIYCWARAAAQHFNPGDKVFCHGGDRLGA